MPFVNVPGVGKVNFPDSMSQADIIAAIERDILPSVKKQEEIPPPSSAGFSLADTATALKQGVIGSAKAITDVFGAENVVSSKLGAIQKELGEEYTPQRKAEMARREALQQQAAKTGSVRDEIGAFLAGVAEAPVQSLAQGLGSIVPYIGTGVLGAIAKLAAPTVRAVNTAVGAAQGAGSVKGSLYDSVKNELVKSGVSEQEADAQARQAQEYLGANFLDIIGGTALGGAAARFGVENLLTPGAAARLNASLLPRMGKAALAEAPLEGAQAGQEQLAINRALQKEGFSVGTFEGVLGAAARDAAVGAMVGSTVGAVRMPGAPAQKTIADEDKSKEVKDQEAALQNLPPPPPELSDAETEALLQPVINEKGELLQQGGVDVTQQTDVTTSGAGTEVSGGPQATTTTKGAPGAGRPGVVSAEGAGIAAEGGEGVQQPALTDQEKTAAYAASRAALEQAQVGPPVRNVAFPTTNLAEYQAGLARDQEKAAAAETTRQTALQEVAGKTIPQVKTDEELRVEYDLAKQEFDQQQASTKERISTLEAERARLVEEETANEEIDNGEKIAAVDAELDTLEGSVVDSIPAWDKLNKAEKDVFLGNLKATRSAADFDNAVRALSNFRTQQKGTEKLTPDQQRVAAGYDENRKTYGKNLGIEFPTWAKLSPDAKSAYLNTVKNNTPVEQDTGFDAVAGQLETEGAGLRGVSRAGVEALKLKGTEAEAKARTTEEVAKAKAAEESAQGKGQALSDDVVEALQAGDVNLALTRLSVSSKGFKPFTVKGKKAASGALDYLGRLREKASQQIFSFIASSLNTVTFNSKVVLDPNDEVVQRLQKEGKLAEYDPKTDTFYFTPAGMDESTFLHEAVHAATVKLINQYLTDPSQLTPEQREGLEHLDKIYQFSKTKLGGRFKNAYENLYEFVSYALTDNKFQIALAETQVRPLAKYTVVAKNLWKQFTDALSKIYGLFSPRAEKVALDPELFAEVAKEYKVMDPDSLYEAQDEVIEDVVDYTELATETGYAREGRETEAKVKKQKTRYKPAEKFLTQVPGYEGNLLLEVSEIFSRILATPESGIEVAPLALKKAEPLRADEEIFLKDYKDSAYSPSEDYQPKDIKYVKNLFFTKEGWRKIATALQNERYAIKFWEDRLDLANKINYEGKDKINNIYTQLTLSVSRAKNIFYDTVQDTYEKLNKSVVSLSEALNLDMKDTLDSLHRIMEALHDPERRLAKYVMTVPLSTDKNIPQGNTMISAADRREQIMRILNTKTITDQQARQLRAELNTLIFTTDANGQQVPNTKYVDPNGSSPRKGKTAMPIELNNEIYNATGLSPAAAAARIDKYNKLDPKIKALVDNVIAQQKEIHRITTDLNKAANYWSQPVSNRVAFYGFNNYVPLKGIDKHTEADEMLDFDGAKLGKELQETAYSFDGRMSVSDNPVLQSMSDVVRAAMRAGRVDLTQSIKNAVKPNKLNPNGQGLLEGEVIKSLTFEERQDENVLKALPRENTIFHYNPDGSIDVIAVRDKNQREAIRRTYRDTNSLVNFANSITSGLGMLHTRYNYNFAPLNYVRDALTNAWALGAEMGPKEAARFIAQITNKVVTGNSLGKGMKLASLYETKDFGKIRELAKKDPVYKEMAEFIEEGGMVSYLQGISLKSNAQQLFKEVGRSGVMTKWDQFNRLLDIWVNMFELSSRSAAYAIAKKNFMNNGMSEAAAKTKAAAYAKNLANFEQVGKYGREMGAAFMFFRPSATGAVRAIEAVAPAFQKLDQVVAALPDNIKSDPKALADFKANYAFRQKSARYMVTALMGSGAFAYMMALMMADEDDLGRNKVMNDDMNQWNRFARFYIPGFENPLQVPWGFGLGSFLASGAQFAAVLTGQQSIGGALGNIATQISLDSFVPIPVSRMDVTDNPAAWFVDSLTPSALRPAVEFVMNKNGLGQDIYNDSNRRMGDAYLGSDHIPETYKLIAANLFKETGGAIDISPNTLYFLANSYFDGPSRVIDSIVNSTYLIAGTKEFKAKTDIPFVGSFIGSVPNVDSREFKKLEQKIEDKQQRFGNAELDPVLYAKMLAKDPLAPVVIAIYNDTVGSQLKDLRQEANRIRRDQNLTPKDKTQLLKVNAITQNLIKYNMKQAFEAYGVKP